MTRDEVRAIRAAGQEVRWLDVRIKQALRARELREAEQLKREAGRIRKSIREKYNIIL